MLRKDQIYVLDDLVFLGKVKNKNQRLLQWACSYNSITSQLLMFVNVIIIIVVVSVSGTSSGPQLKTQHSYVAASYCYLVALLLSGWAKVQINLIQEGSVEVSIGTKVLIDINIHTINRTMASELSTFCARLIVTIVFAYKQY